MSWSDSLFRCYLLSCFLFCTVCFRLSIPVCLLFSFSLFILTSAHICLISRCALVAHGNFMPSCDPVSQQTSNQCTVSGSGTRIEDQPFLSSHSVFLIYSLSSCHSFSFFFTLMLQPSLLPTFPPLFHGEGYSTPSIPDPEPTVYGTSTKSAWIIRPVHLKQPCLPQHAGKKEKQQDLGGFHATAA